MALDAILIIRAICMQDPSLLSSGLALDDYFD